MSDLPDMKAFWTCFLRVALRPAWYGSAFQDNLRPILLSSGLLWSCKVDVNHTRKKNPCAQALCLEVIQRRETVKLHTLCIAAGDRGEWLASHCG